MNMTVRLNAAQFLLVAASPPPPASDKPTLANLLARRKKYTELASCKIAELLETERTYVQKVGWCLAKFVMRIYMTRLKSWYMIW